MNFSINKVGGKATISMSGRFTFTDNDAFREIVGKIDDGSFSSCVIDMSGLEFMDSAGLGMLLLAHETAQQRSIDLRLAKPKGEVRRILDVSRFGDIIPIDN